MAGFQRPHVLSQNSTRIIPGYCMIDLINPDDYSKFKTVSIIYCVSSLLSMLGAGSVIAFSLSRRVVKSPEVRPLFHLALADFLLALTWLSGAALWLSSPDKEKIFRPCFLIDAISEIFHIATFLLTVNYALNVFIRLKERTYGIQNLYFTTVSTNSFYSWLFAILYAICWSIPVLLMVPLITKMHIMAHKNKVHCSRCLLLFDRPRASSFAGEKQLWQVYGSVMLASTLGISILALLVMYFLAERLYRKAVLRSGILTDRQRAGIDDMRQRIFLYIMVFLVCWSPALIVAATDLDRDMKEDNTNILLRKYFPLFVIQGLTAPMQGFLNSIVYGWTRRSFREAANQSLLEESFSASYGSLGL
ncbi:transmembrane protein 116 isoform X1 [Nematostella vectensis]|uniref:transmembrane protein 116 isoform X1 n=1 Tax=Nematostella vectensis TaxID=45351 RepID=UPI0020777D19|nr:transmembrane protein 116 isoform X1 [Nematostella vectensis]